MRRWGVFAAFMAVEWSGFWWLAEIHASNFFIYYFLAVLFFNGFVVTPICKRLS